MARTRKQYERKCEGCGNQFTTTVIRKLYCKKDCGRKGDTHTSRALARLTNDITFIGVDGEGVDRPDGKHEYVMLSVGSETLWDNGKALTLQSILKFLWECYTENPDAAYVGFFLGYDFIQWEKLLPENVARSLLTSDGIKARTSQRRTRANPYPDAVVWEGWELDIMAGRRFKLRPHIHHKSRYENKCRNRTCDKEMESAPVLDIGEPAIIDPHEMDWRVPENNGSWTEWKGTAAAFWKQFVPRMHGVGTNGHPKSTAAKWLYICDTGPFWQTSFLNVINPKGWDNPVVTEKEYNLIVSGKAERGTIADYNSTDYFEEMRRYNVLENDVLARVTTRLNQGFMNDTIPIKLKKNEWYGPGRAAQTWMDMLHTKLADPIAVEHNKTMARNPDMGLTRMNECGLTNADVYMSMPTWFYEAAQASYYGGWFEQMVHGHCGDVWEYDINSAYPFIIANLPCLHTSGKHNGRYEQGEGHNYPDDSAQYTLVYATVQGSNLYIGAMPHRIRQGNILRPHITKGWYWLHEIEASRRAGLVDRIDVETWVSYVPCECDPPFNPTDIGIERMYQMRIDVGKNSPQGKAAKLVYNSAYGKTAQSIGTPKYSNPVYASLITAGCRTLILEAISTHPQGASAVTMVATDGVYFTERHTSLDLDKTRLGAWDETFKPNITQLMPGVYWDDNTRNAIRTGGKLALKSRGINATDLANQIDRIDRGFAHGHTLLRNGGNYEWPTLQIKVNFLLDSAKLALQRGKWETAGRVQHGTTRCIDSNPKSKREPTAYRCDTTGLTRTHPYLYGTTLETTGYKKEFGFVADETDLVMDRDGTDGMQYWRDILKGNL